MESLLLILVVCLGKSSHWTITECIQVLVLICWTSATLLIWSYSTTASNTCISTICLFLSSLTAVTPLTISPLQDALTGLGFLGRIFVWLHRKFFVHGDTAVIIPTPSWEWALQAGVSFYKCTLHSFCLMPLYIPHIQPNKWPGYLEYLYCQHKVPHHWRTFSTDLKPSPHTWVLTCYPHLYAIYKLPFQPVPRQESAHHKLKKNKNSTK